MKEVVVGSLRLSRAMSLKQEFETAAWHRTGMFEPQVVPLVLVDGKTLVARGLKGVVTSSYLGTLFGGLPVGKGGANEDVGQPMEKSLQFYDYSVRSMLDPIIAERDYHVTLNEQGRELLGRFLPPLPGETVGEFAARRTGRSPNEVIVEEVSLHKLAPHPHEGKPDPKVHLEGGFVNGQFHLFTTRWPDVPAKGEPWAKPVAQFCYCHPYGFASRIVANAQTVIEQRAGWRDKARNEFITLGEVLAVKPREPDTAYGALSGTLNVNGETYVRHAELKRPDASLSLMPTVVADLLDAEGNIVDVEAVFDEKIAVMVRDDVYSLGSAVLGTLNIGSSVLPPVMSSSQYASILAGRQAAFEENLPAHAILRIDTTSAAFEDIGRNVEMARILGVAAEQVKSGASSFAVADTNGNKVARFELVATVPDESPSHGAAPNGRVRLQVDLAGLPMGRLADTLAPVLEQAQEKVLAAEGSFMLTNADGAFIGAVVINDVPARERSAELGVEP